LFWGPYGFLAIHISKRVLFHSRNLWISFMDYAKENLGFSVL
jgi:hypothetical protein